MDPTTGDTNHESTEVHQDLRPLSRNPSPAASSLQNGSGSKIGAGIKTLPRQGMGQGNYGAGVPGGPFDPSLYSQFFMGPYNIGVAMRDGTVGSLPTMTWLSAAINVFVTGWMINSITGRDSVLDVFGLVASGGAQVVFGVFASPLPAYKTSTSQ
jgi:hypothetical protein